MTKKQRESAAKYLYDISKGIALLAVVGNIVKGKWSLLTLFFGISSSVIFFIVAFMLEKRVNHE